MTLAQVITLINDNIVPNNNNEITANVLRPILIEMLQQPNDLIGVLSNLTTNNNSNIINAINELKENIDNLDNITVFKGIGDPNSNPPTGVKTADLYSEIDITTIPVDLWIFNGVEWILLSDKFVSYTPQVLTAPEQQQARQNIDALGTKPNGTDDLITGGNINSAYAQNLVPTARTITINGQTFDLSQDRTWTIPTGGQLDSIQASFNSTNVLDVQETGTATDSNLQFSWQGSNEQVVLADGTTVQIPDYIVGMGGLEQFFNNMEDWIQCVSVQTECHFPGM